MFQQYGAQQNERQVGIKAYGAVAGKGNVGNARMSAGLSRPASFSMNAAFGFVCDRVPMTLAGGRQYVGSVICAALHGTHLARSLAVKPQAVLAAGRFHVTASKSSAAWRSRNTLVSSSEVWLTMRPRCTAGRDAILSAQRST